METIVKLYTNTENEISKFLEIFQGEDKNGKDNAETYSKNHLEWQKKYQNPTEIVDIIGTFIENNDKYKINMWISLDPGLFINITDYNAEQVIRYIYERYPW